MSLKVGDCVTRKDIKSSFQGKIVNKEGKVFRVVSTNDDEFNSPAPFYLQELKAIPCSVSINNAVTTAIKARADYMKKRELSGASRRRKKK